jgi:F-type H+-transporting ATPase subunit delta
MAKTTPKSSVATAYASSLLELANEQKQADAIRQELGNLRQIINENRSLAMFFVDPGVGVAERSALLDRIFGGKLSPLMHSFIGVVNQKGRLGVLPQIADAYDALHDAQLGRVDVDVTVASELTGQQLDEVRKRVSAAMKKDAIVHQQVDDGIIGGFIVRVQDKLIDASVKTQLAAMKQQLLTAGRK